MPNSFEIGRLELLKAQTIEINSLILAVSVMQSMLERYHPDFAGNFLESMELAKQSPLGTKLQKKVLELQQVIDRLKLQNEQIH